MKTSELTGAQLDYWVAKAQGMHLFKAPPFDIAGDRWQWTSDDLTMLHSCSAADWRPSTDWAQGGLIIEREMISVLRMISRPDEWTAIVRAFWGYNGPETSDETSKEAEGPTPLIAAMRAYVDSKFGEFVPDDPQ